MSKTSTRACAAIGITAVSLFAAACGGGASGGGTTGSTDSAGLAQAKAVVQKASARPDSLTVTQPIGKPVPTGKKIVFVSCGVEACAVQGPILQEAASILGWSVKQVATDGTPEKVQGAIDAAIRDHADAVIINAADRDALSKQI